MFSYYYDKDTKELVIFKNGEIVEVKNGIISERWAQEAFDEYVRCAEIEACDVLEIKGASLCR